MIIRPRFVIGILAIGSLVGLAGVIAIGSEIARSSQADIGPAPRSLGAEDVQFRSESGSLLKGWLIPGSPGFGAVVLMHGIHANRLAMLSRARFLSRTGYTVLLFDFQAHGESIGDHQTFGYLESRDARAACAFLQSRVPAERIGALGSSLGGAAAILGREPLPVQALVAEAVYPTIEEATSNRIALRLGAPGRLLTPLLTSQLRLRLGISPADLHPIDSIRKLKAPLFLIAGSEDPDTTPPESRRLFHAAPEPKQYWEIQGAGHRDFHACAKDEYEKRVLEFFEKYLRGE